MYYGWAVMIVLMVFLLAACGAHDVAEVGAGLAVDTALVDVIGNAL